MHVPHCRGQDVDTGGLNELFRLLRGRESLREVRSHFMYFRAGPDIADLTLYQDRGIDRFQGVYRLSRLADIFFEW